MTGLHTFLAKGFVAGLIVTTLLSTSVAQAQVYRTVDANGNVIFTDKKPKNDDQAEAVEIGPILTLPATPVKPRPPRTSSQQNKAASAVYDSIVITTPADEETFRNVPSITVTAKVTPPAKGGHRFRLLLDGNVEQDSDSPQFKIEQPSRGAHSLQVQVIDRQGKALISSGVSTIYVHRHSVHFNKEAGQLPGEVAILPIKQ